MNIDVVNKQVSNTLSIQEKKVKLINQFYWRQIYEHLYNYNANPVNIDNICVIYPEKKGIKKAILTYLNRLRFIKTSDKFVKGSDSQLGRIDNYSNYIRNFLKLRKQNKFNN